MADGSPKSAMYDALAAEALAADDGDLYDRLSDHARYLRFNDPVERQALIDERARGILENIQRLTQWGVEETGKYSYLGDGVSTPTMPREPGEEERKGVRLYSGVQDTFDADLLATVYAQIGVTEARANAEPIQIGRVSSEDGGTPYVGHRMFTTWGIELLEVEDAGQDIVIRELWATK